MQENNLKKYILPEKFLIGASNSAWQTEGWGGKKEGHDTFIDLWYKSTPEFWRDGVGPAIAADVYHNYKGDAKLMKQCGLQIFRTTIDWSRFIKDFETGEVDEDGVKFYEDYLKEMIANGVEPMLGLEIWDIPAELFQKYGGWESRHVVDLYTMYAEKAFQRLGHLVKRWFTFIEPLVIQTRCLLDGLRFPFRQNTQLTMQWHFHKILATAKAVEVFKKGKYNGKIGVALNPEVICPRSSDLHDQKAGEMYDLFFNKLYLDPSVKGEIPKELFEILKLHNCMFKYSDEDLRIIKDNTVDFLGINLYYPARVKARNDAWNPDVPFHPAYYYDMHELQGRRMNPHRGWEIYPRIMYDMAIKLKNEYGNIEWMISENGMGVEGEEKFKNSEDEIQDDYRIEFLSEHLAWLLKAVEEGCNCTGYMMYAFIDAVSPMNALKNRYGLVEIEIDNNRKRRIKKSGHWYKKLSEDRFFYFRELEPEYK